MKLIFLPFLFALILVGCNKNIEQNYLFIAGDEEGFNVVVINDTLEVDYQSGATYNEKMYDFNQDGDNDLRFSMWLDTNLAFSGAPLPISYADYYRATIKITFQDSFNLAITPDYVNQYEYYGDTIYDFYGTFPRATYTMVRTNSPTYNSLVNSIGYVSYSFQIGEPIPNGLNYIKNSNAEFFIFCGARNNALYQLVGNGWNDSLIGYWNCFEELPGSIPRGTITYIPFEHTVNGTTKAGWISLLLTTDYKLIILKSAFKS